MLVRVTGLLASVVIDRQKLTLQLCQACFGDLSTPAATRSAWFTGNTAQALANAEPYLQAQGHTVLVCLWLEVAIATLRQDTSLSIAANAGRIRAAAYFYHFKLPKIGACL